MKDKRSELRKELKKVFQEKYRNLASSKQSVDKLSHIKFLYKKLKF